MAGLFRIMGGASNNKSSSTTSANSQGTSTTQPSSQAARNNNLRYTYPGNRATAPPPPAVSSSYSTPPMTLPTETPLTGMATISTPGLTSSGTSTASASTTNSSLPVDHVVVRGSSVAQGASPAPVSSSGTGVAVDTTASSRPGAYQVSRTSVGPAQVYRVTVPNGVRPGAEFTVHAGNRRVRVRCPTTSKPGQSLQITLPPEPITNSVPLKIAPLTAPDDRTGGGGRVAMLAEVLRVNQQAAESGGTAQTFLVTIPPNIYPGMQFTVNVSGQRFMVTCPASAGPNQKVRIVPPVAREEPEAAPKTQVFEVAVPAGVAPGQPFALVANGQRVLVTCPPNVVPGQKIRFQLPVSQVVGNIQLAYESETGGWRRTIRVTDLKFQWVRLEKDKSSRTLGSGGASDEKGKEEKVKEDDAAGPAGESQDPTDSSAGAAVNVDGMERFDFNRSAYVRKVTFLEGNDARMRTGNIELVPANEAVVDSRLVVQNRPIVSYADIAAVQGKALEEKTEWFQRICTQLTAAWEDGHIKIVVRRKYLLLDSVDAVMSLGRDDLRKRWRIEFLGEPGIDAGGVTREWFQLVTEQVFDPDFGLWLPSANNQMCMNINPASAVSCPEDHLIYFRFLGRVIGRALFDRQLIKGHMVRTLYKHLLGWPITFDDIQAQDEDYYQSLRKLTKMDDISTMCLDFTVTEDIMGGRQEVELIEGGAMKEVTNENLPQYLEANLRYRMLDRTKLQLTELLLGFFDVVPEPALTVFDANELELILCGLPEIDMEDWKANTKYSGLFEAKGKKHQVVEWFWQVVHDEFDQEMKARLLQFVTGTAGVPSRGFSVLQGIDGNIKLFTVHGVDVKAYPYPRAHTCFNRIDLPNYTNKAELFERLKIAITLSGVGFGIE